MMKDTGRAPPSIYDNHEPASMPVMYPILQSEIDPILPRTPSSIERSYVTENRHLSKMLWGEKDDHATPREIQPWRMVTPRLRIMDVALVLCLNIGTDPPDIVKPNPCARKECWIEPFSMPAQKALETIGIDDTRSCHSCSMYRCRLVLDFVQRL
jgi:hypothetical protein